MPKQRNKDALMRPWGGWGGLGLILVTFLLTSCASWEARYLKEATNHAAMAEVENHLGQPHATWDLRTGETLWTYQSGVPSGTDSSGITIVGPGWVIGRRSDCTAYLLLFDQQKILRAWMRQACDPDRPRMGSGWLATSHLVVAYQPGPHY